MSILAKDHNGHRIQAIRPGTIQTVAVGSGSLQTVNAVQGETSIAVITSDVDALYAVGTNPSAVAGHPLWAKQPVFIRVRPGKDKVAFIKNGTDSGTGYVSEGDEVE